MTFRLQCRMGLTNVVLHNRTEDTAHIILLSTNFLSIFSSGSTAHTLKQYLSMIIYRVVGPMKDNNTSMLSFTTVKKKKASSCPSPPHSCLGSLGYGHTHFKYTTTTTTRQTTFKSSPLPECPAGFFFP